MNINWEVVLWTCITLVFIMGIIGLVLLFVSAKNMRKRRGELGEVHTQLKIGSQVMFAGGIYGRVVGFEGEDVVNVEIAKSTIVKISRYAIQSIT